jgi:hypothetical protein
MSEKTYLSCCCRMSGTFKSCSVMLSTRGRFAAALFGLDLGLVCVLMLQLPDSRQVLQLFDFCAIYDAKCSCSCEAGLLDACFCVAQAQRERIVASAAAKDPSMRKTLHKIHFCCGIMQALHMQG